MYLSKRFYIEPLIMNWHAWIGLMHPLSMSLEINERALRALRSYLKSPERHYKYANKPEFCSGPYINLPSEYCEQVELLIQQTENNLSEPYHLAKALLDFQDSLHHHANGETLEPYYNQLPKGLENCIELTYDMNHQPSVRVIESLIYQQLYNPNLQNVLLSQREQDNRPFVLQTPRFEEESNILLNIPFSSENISCLMRAKDNCVDVDALSEQLQIPQHKRALFKSFFTDESPKADCEPATYDEINVKYFGHACVLLQHKGINILSDPLLTSGTGDDRFTYADLPEKIDYVVITHAHQDHLSIETLLNIRHKIGSIIVPKNNSGSLADPSMKLMLKAIGFDSIIEIEECERLSLGPNMEIRGLPFWGEHGDLDIRSKISYCISLNNKHVLLMADAKVIHAKAYQQLLADLPQIDLLFIGMECHGAPFSWTYGPLFVNRIPPHIDSTRRLGGSYSKHVTALLDVLNCKQVCVYAMGMEPWLSHILGITYEPDAVQLKEVDALKAYCQKCSTPIQLLQGKSQWTLC